MPLKGSYEIVDELGRGAAGVVFRARDRSSGTLVAIKVLHDPRDGDPAALGSRQRLLREAAILARIDHPNVVRIIEVDAGRDGASLVTELVDGGSLRELLSVRGGRLETYEAASLVAQAARALHVVHAQSLVHRDIKPENLLLASDGTLKITDFGIAAHLLERRDADAGYLLGTPAYVAPEQLSGRAVDPRADIWSLGAVLFECLTGRPPFEGSDAGDVAKRIVQQQAPRLETLLPECSPELASLVADALEADPDRRPASGLELARRLEAAVIPSLTRREKLTARTRLEALSRSAAPARRGRARDGSSRKPAPRAARSGRGIGLTVLATLLLAFAARESGLIEPPPVAAPRELAVPIEGPAGSGGVGIPVTEAAPGPTLAAAAEPTRPVLRESQGPSGAAPVSRPAPAPARLATGVSQASPERRAPPAPQPAEASAREPAPTGVPEREPDREPEGEREPEREPRAPEASAPPPAAPTRARGERAAPGTLIVEIEHPLERGSIEILLDGRVRARLRIGVLLEAPPGQPAIALAEAEARAHRLEVRIRSDEGSGVDASWAGPVGLEESAVVVSKLRLSSSRGAWRLLPY